MQNILQCIDCKHLHPIPAAGPFTPQCDAFPEEIPTVILVAEHDHRWPFPGDHGIRFEPIDAPSVPSATREE